MSHEPYEELLAKHRGLYVHQWQYPCCSLKRCCTCEPKQNFRVFDEHDNEILFNIEEETGCCLRCCCRDNRPWSMQMNTGDCQEGTTPLLQFERPLRCDAGAGKCCRCCQQEVKVFSANARGNADTFLGYVKEECWCCVPKFHIYDANGKPEYEIRQPTCCCGCCVRGQGCGCSTQNASLCACCCCRRKIPFYVYPEGTLADDWKPACGEINKVWRGMWRELNNEDAFECFFPQGAEPASKARLLAATLLINQVFFEGGDEDDDFCEEDNSDRASRHSYD